MQEISYICPVNLCSINISINWYCSKHLPININNQSEVSLKCFLPVIALISYMITKDTKIDKPQQN